MTQCKLTGSRLNNLQRIAEEASQKKVLYLQPKVKKELEMRSTFKILFYANKGKEKDGIVPIMGRITINGTQCHRNMQNRLFLFPHWVYSIPTIPSMTQPRKNSERNAKEEKEARAEIVSAHQ